MYYTYVLKSLKDNKLHTGCSPDLKSRLNKQEEGKVESTKNRKPLMLIYYEACLNEKDAIKREKYLKTHYGKMFLKNRLSKWCQEER